MPQPRSSTAVWIALALIVAAIACVMLGAENVRHESTPKGLSAGILALYIGSLVGSAYFAIRLGAAGVMIVVGRPINRTVAWLSATEAFVHCMLVLACVIATILLAPPQGFGLVAVGDGLALAALFVMSQYPNLAETQGWAIEEPAPVAARTRAPAKPSGARTPAVVAPVIASPTVIAAPPIATEAPRAPAPRDDAGPSMLR